MMRGNAFWFVLILRFDVLICVVISLLYSLLFAPLRDGEWQFERRDDEKYLMTYLMHVKDLRKDAGQGG